MSPTVRGFTVGRRSDNGELISNKFFYCLELFSLLRRVTLVALEKHKNYAKKINIPLIGTSSFLARRQF